MRWRTTFRNCRHTNDSTSSSRRRLRNENASMRTSAEQRTLENVFRMFIATMCSVVVPSLALQHRDVSPTFYAVSLSFNGSCIIFSVKHFCGRRQYAFCYTPLRRWQNTCVHINVFLLISSEMNERMEKKQ